MLISIAVFATAAREPRREHRIELPDSAMSLTHRPAPAIVQSFIMCGIAGILSLSPKAPVIEQELRAMAGALVHRGPDDEGIAVLGGGRCGLAFRRLAIIDLAGGHQPISNESGAVWAVFNGEIYNFRELRDELIAAGHRFVTSSDSEVVVHAYEQWGSDFPRRLSGMFAIGIWDDRAGTLLLVRDRFGKKPLVTARVGDKFYFASEAKALLALPDVPRAIDADALHEYLVLQYVPAPRSIFRGFEKLAPGHLRLLRSDPENRSDAAPPPRPWWTIPRPTPFRGSYEQARAELGQRIEAAVKRRLIADVPLGAFLSGGVDSSIVVGMMRKLGVAPLRTFSIGFPDPRYDETAAARQVAKLFQTEHHEFLVTPRATEILDTLAYHFDEPFADSSAIPTWYVSRETRATVTVALTGDGGDEAFAGYDRYRAAQIATRLDWAPAGLRRVLGSLAELLPHGQAKSLGNRAYRFLRAVGKPPVERYADWVSVMNEVELHAAYRPEFLEKLCTPLAERPALRFLQSVAPPDTDDPVEIAAATDYGSYLPFDLLTKVDIASMACSLECRAPFLDHELVDFALSLPTEWKLGRTGGKKILKDWASSLLPWSILNRPKMGFGVPIGEWFRGDLRDILRDALFAPNALVTRVFQAQFLRRLFDDHLAGRANHAHRLWSLLMLELWNRRWQPR